MNVAQLQAIIKQQAAELALEKFKRQEAENKVRQQVEYLQFVLKASRINFWDWDLKTNLMEEFGFFDPISYECVNDEIGSFEVIRSRVLPCDREKVRIEIAEVIEKKKAEYNVEFRAKMHNGSIEWIMCRGQAYYDEEGNVARIAGLGAIVTRRKKTDALIFKNQVEMAALARLNAIAEMASLLAHELTQPLMVISTYVSGCLNHLHKEKFDKMQLINAMEKVVEHVNIVGEAIHSMKNSVRNKKLNYETVSLNEVITESLVVLQLHEALYAYSKLHFDLDRNLPVISIDKTQIALVLLNLTYTSMMILFNEKIADSSLIIKSSVLNNEFVSINIITVNTDFDFNIQNGLFSRFHLHEFAALKMDISACRVIIENHGGKILVYSLLGSQRSSCIEILLPIDDNDNDRLN